MTKIDITVDAVMKGLVIEEREAKIQASSMEIRD